MTIKPVPNQKSNEKNNDHSNGHNQIEQASNTVNNHRNLSNNVESYSQSPQRRSDVFEDISRHKRSPQKSNGGRQKRNGNDHIHNAKRLTENREKINNGQTSTPYLNKVISTTQHHPGRISPHSHLTGINVNTTTPGCSTTKSPKHNNSVNNSNVLITQSSSSLSPKCQLSPRSASLSNVNSDNDNKHILMNKLEETLNGYNSGDEWIVPKEGLLSADEWTKRDDQFGKAMENRSLIIKNVEEDGACLFRAISLQIYGDQEMHDFIRQQTMDYIYQNSEYFAQFVTEDINNYVKRKRNINSHGNHIEIQAMSELYNRPVELYCYQTTPINIFNSEQISNGQYPLRLSYQRGSHYNAIVDPYNASVGVGLGLADYKPESQTCEAMQLSEQLEIEQTMFEDKLKTTDREATNEALQEQVARESYLQWCRENMLKNRNNKNDKRKNNDSTITEDNKRKTTSGSISSTSTNATITSAEAFKNSFIKHQLQNQSPSMTFTESCYITSIKTTIASTFKNNVSIDSITSDKVFNNNKHNNNINDSDNDNSENNGHISKNINSINVHDINIICNTSTAKIVELNCGNNSNKNNVNHNGNINNIDSNDNKNDTIENKCNNNIKINNDNNNKSNYNNNDKKINNNSNKNNNNDNKYQNIYNDNNNDNSNRNNNNKNTNNNNNTNNTDNNNNSSSNKNNNKNKNNNNNSNNTNNNNGNNHNNDIYYYDDHEDDGDDNDDDNNKKDNECEARNIIKSDNNFQGSNNTIKNYHNRSTATVLNQMIRKNGIGSLKSNDNSYSSRFVNQCNVENNKINAQNLSENSSGNNSKINDSNEYGSDSDDTDKSSTSSIEPNSEIFRLNLKNKKSSKKSNERKKSRILKRKFKECNSENMCSNQYNNTTNNLYRPKKLKIDKIQSKLIKSYDKNSNNLMDYFESDKTFVSNENGLEQQIQPSTSKRNAEQNMLSSFYQSLLESSYTDDGMGQLTENEMIQKAIQMSRIDYFEDQKFKFDYFPIQQQDNDDDST